MNSLMMLDYLGILIDGNPHCIAELTETITDFDKRFVIIEP